ncbi:hypothetical protein BV22DRAFT_1133599 [Leucogyrophana mollusca]|uniref:Uncharacterized protein n=1 Tax=Leucogyrophana mollusca TaxID=85980 RepID=A0ACB8B2X5_9AGAM|nr:hypothetical protein BV22DRAFT_1133599 [Leucogyrophana mollusca]
MSTFPSSLATHNNSRYELSGPTFPPAGSPGSLSPSSVTFQYDAPSRQTLSGQGYAPDTSPANLTQAAPHESFDATALKHWCQRIGNKFELMPAQYSDLQQFVDLGKNLDVGNLQLRIWQQATTYKVLNDVAAQKMEYTTFKGILDDVSERLAGDFKLSKAQTDQVLILLKDFIFQPDCMEYMNHLDVESHIRANATALGFANVMGDPYREKVLRQACKAKASSTCNQYCMHITGSIKGSKMCNLKVATFCMAEKFKKGGPGANLKVEYQLHVVILAPNHSPRPEDEAEAECEGNHGDDNSDDSIPTVPAKCARPGGKAKKGKDFWLVMDRLLASAISQRGKDKRTPDWRTQVTPVDLCFSSLTGIDLS